MLSEADFLLLTPKLSGFLIHGFALRVLALVKAWRRKRNRFYEIPRSFKSKLIHFYIIGNVSKLRFLNFRCENIISCSHIPFFDSHIFTDWVKLVLILNFKRAYATRMTFEIEALLRLTHVPNFYQAIITTRKYSWLRRGKPGHPYTRFMLSYYACFMLCEIFVDFSYFYLHKTINTLRSLEQVTKFL